MSNGIFDYVLGQAREAGRIRSWNLNADDDWIIWVDDVTRLKFAYDEMDAFVAALLLRDEPR